MCDLQIGQTKLSSFANEFRVSMADEAAPEVPHHNCMNFSIGRHPREVLDQMNEYRLSGKLCDIVLRAEDDSFPAHRVVLSAASEYFNGMFCNNMAECQLKEVPLFGVSASTLRTIVEFAYTSEVDNYCSIITCGKFWTFYPSILNSAKDVPIYLAYVCLSVC